MNYGIDYLRNKGFSMIFIANSDLKLSSENIISKMIFNVTEEVGVVVPIIKNLDGTIEQRSYFKVRKASPVTGMPFRGS